jgi:hypothetical protein
LALLHPQGLTVKEMDRFLPVSLDAIRTYTCVTGDADGNLWLGSKAGGVIRVTREFKVLTYSTTNAGFESNRITAVWAATQPSHGRRIAIWVACDKDGGELDTFPDTPEDFGGAALHFYDGLVWDKWKDFRGVRCMLGDGDYLWLGTNKRLRRFGVAPRYLEEDPPSTP